MDQYTFRVPPEGPGPALLFDVQADSPQDAVAKARKLMCEQTAPKGHLHVDLTFGLTAGKLIVLEDDISELGIVQVREDLKPF